MFAPVTISTFCLRISRAHAFAISSSSSGRIRSSASSSTTSLPSRPNADATSVPDAPAPITASEPGSSSSAHAVSVPRTRPPNRRPRIGVGTEPVARTTFRASISVPSLAAPIRTPPSSVRAACPSITSTLFFFISPLTPPVRVLTTLSR